MDGLAIGVDVGGTFTDFVVAGPGGLRITKIPSTPADASDGILAGLDALGVEDWTRFVHGSTVATNALLERSGAPAAFLTTEGFRDMLEIGRQTRLDLYSVAPRKHVPLIPRERCFEVPERIDRFGAILTPLDVKALERALDEIAATGSESLAICFLFSFANPVHERMAGEYAAARGLMVSLSSDIMPEHREYERASTVVANAYLRPLVERYLGRLRTRVGRVARSTFTRPAPRIMQSNGGIISLEAAARDPVRMVLSGPAGGVVAAWQLGRQAGLERIISFDMGGTSTDVALIDGEPQLARDATIDHLPIGVPMLDIHTVGAGGGSIAFVDRGGALRVGPQSAGADPGPAAYGRGECATVTDANLTLSRFYVPAFLGGRMTLDRPCAEAAVGAVAAALRVSLTDAALGITRVANAQMARAVRRVSLERGYDPREYWLIAFGGSGPLHACDLAGEVGAAGVMIPRYPGALSALGLLLSDVVRDYSLTVMRPTASAPAGWLARQFRALEKRAKVELAGENITRGAVRLQRGVDMRYRGQSYEIAVPAASLQASSLDAGLHDRHRAAFGYASEGEATEIVALRLRASGAVEKPFTPAGETRNAPLPRATDRQLVFFERWRDCRVIDRARLAPGHRLKGPALLVQEDTTVLLPPGWLGCIDPWYNVLLTRNARTS